MGLFYGPQRRQETGHSLKEEIGNSPSVPMNNQAGGGAGKNSLTEKSD